MRRAHVSIAVGLLAAAVVAIALLLRTEPEANREASGPISGAETASSATPGGAAHEGMAAKIVQAAERLGRPGCAEVAARVHGEGTCVCLFVDAPERYYELDVGLGPEDFPWLDTNGFRPPPRPVGKIVSRYRAVAKGAMGYDWERGDRIVVLLCPRSEWPRLQQHWPEQRVAGPRGTKALLQNPLRRPEAERERRGQGGRSRRFKGQNRRCRPTQSLGARSRSKPGWGSATAPKAAIPVCPRVAAAPVARSRGITIESATVVVPADPGSVQRYSRIELLVELSDVAATEFYDPDPATGGLDLHATFTGPSAETWDVNGFYDAGQWRIRFAPDRVGPWLYSVTAEDPSGTSNTVEGSFECVSSSYHGWARVRGHYLRFTDGQSVFAVGHNTGWQPDVEQPSFTEMSARGENLLSFWMSMPWALPSWASEEEPYWDDRAPFENAEGGIGHYNQAACAYVDGLVQRADAAGVHLLPTVWAHDQLRDDDHPWGEGSWANNAYSTLCAAADFYATTDGNGVTPQWRYQKNLYRYFIARWGYSRAIAGWVIVCEIDGTTGAYRNPEEAEAWCGEVRDYFAANDKFRRNASEQYPLVATKVDTPGWDSAFDLRATDSYAQWADDVEVAGTIAAQTSTMWASGKPGFHAEFGGNTTWGATQPTHLHNGIWAGTAAGAAMTPLVWCDGGSFPMLTPDMQDHLQYMSEFTAGIDYVGSASLEPASVNILGRACRGWSMRMDDRGFAWVQNTAGNIDGQTLAISGLSPGGYTIEWYDVWADGETPTATDAAAVDAGGELAVAMPSLSRADVACKFLRTSAPGRLLSVSSTPITDVDITGDKPGTTPYTAACTDQQAVSITAPQEADQKHFVRWEDDQGSVLTYLRELHLTMDADKAPVAVYGDVADFYVNDEAAEDGMAPGDDENPGTSPDAPMRNIQALLERYPDIGGGCTVHVSAGLYEENVTIGETHCGLTLEGAGAEASVIDGGENESCIILDAFEDGEISGFTIRNGSAPSGLLEYFGGGIRCANGSSATIRDNTFTGNRANWGGAIGCVASSPIVEDNSFTDNSAVNGGGGIGCFYTSPATIRGNTLNGNSAQRGGGIYIEQSEAVVQNNTVTGNSASHGGGIDLINCSPTVENNLIAGNSADYGAGIDYVYSSAPITNNTVSGNSAVYMGGGIYGISGFTPTIANCILWDNSAPDGPEIALVDVCDLAVRYSDVEGGQAAAYTEAGCEITWGDGNIDADPLFAGPGHWDGDTWVDGDYHLTAGSPCVDSADGDTAPDTDMDGNSRHDDAGTPNTGAGDPPYADMGACEFQGSSPLHIEHGVVTVGHRWTTVSFPEPFDSAPVVVAGPATRKDREPGVVRVQKVTKGSFRIRFEEWPYLNGKHNKERIAWVAVEPVVYPLGREDKLIAGKFKTGCTNVKKPKKVAFPEAFADTPIVLTQVLTTKGRRAVTDRICDVRARSFKVAMQEQETSGSHPKETIGYVAVSKAVTDIGGASCATGVTRKKVTHKAFKLSTSKGACKVFIEEEKSHDEETSHCREKVGYLAFGGTPLLIADMQTCTEPDTATVRYLRTLAASPSACRLRISAEDQGGGAVSGAVFSVAGQSRNACATLAGKPRPLVQRLPRGTTVTLEAQKSLADGQRVLAFDLWKLDGLPSPVGQTTVELKMTRHRKAVAVYRTEPRGDRGRAAPQTSASNTSSPYE